MTSTNPSNNTALEPNIHQLTIPQEFRSYETIQEGDVIIHLEEWRRRAYVVLSDLQTKLQNDEKLSLDLQAKVMSAVAQFDGEGPWILETSREVARGALFKSFKLFLCLFSDDKSFWSHTTIQKLNFWKAS